MTFVSWAIVFLIFAGCWQIGTWIACLFGWRHKSSTGEVFRKTLDELPDLDTTLEDLIDELEYIADKKGVKLKVVYERFTPSLN